MFDDEVGQGLPLWLPKGAFIRHKIMDFAFNTYLEHGYEPVCTPPIFPPTSFGIILVI